MRKFSKILLIDDDPIANFINARTIRSAGLSDRIKIAMNGGEAINYLMDDCKMDQDYPDLIFVDINMPGMNGFEFIAAYEMLNIKVKPVIIMLTASIALKDLNLATELGIQMLNKPLKAEILKSIFEKKEAH